MAIDYISIPVISVDTKANNEAEEYFAKTFPYKSHKVLVNTRIYDEKEERKRLMRELNEMVSKWK
jgi:hypothetical protein